MSTSAARFMALLKWKKMTSQQQADHVRKMVAGRRKARKARKAKGESK